MATAATISIERALNDLDVVDLLVSSLNNYGHDTLSEPERRLFTEAYDGGDEQAFCHLFGPEKIPEHLGSFLGYFMVRKVFASRELLRAAGTVSGRLVRWLEREGYVEADVAAEAIERAKAAAHDLPRADRLGELLADLTDADPPGLEELADDCFVEDYLPIERIEPEVNVVMARTASGWRLLEVGCVYP